MLVDRVRIPRFGEPGIPSLSRIGTAIIRNRTDSAASNGRGSTFGRPHRSIFGRWHVSPEHGTRRSGAVAVRVRYHRAAAGARLRSARASSQCPVEGAGTIDDEQAAIEG